MSFVSPFALAGRAGEPEEIENANAVLAAQESGYIAPDVEADQDAIAQAVFTRLAVRVPGWQAHDGNLDTWIIEAVSEIGAELRALAASVPASIFTVYGERVLGIPPDLATAATGLATFTAIDAKGYTIDTGTTFALARSGNDLIAYATLQEAEIPVGEVEVAGVPFAAVETGSVGNDLLGEGQMLDPLTWVAAVTVPAPTRDGADAETPEEYVDRLANLFPTVGLRPVLPQDFAVLALQVRGVGRAVAMNLYEPTTDTWDNARTVTLVLAQESGQPCAADVKAATEQMLEDLREVNWIVNVLDPNYVAIDVTFDVVAFAGQDAETVRQVCIDNITLYLDPANYRLGETSPAVAGGEVIYPPTPGEPVRRQYIYVNELIALLDRSLGVDLVVSVQINGTADDFQMPEHWTLPTPGLIDGTVSGTGIEGGGGGPQLPTIGSVTPDTVAKAGGDTITITGTGLTGATAVYFGPSKWSTNVAVASDVSMTCVTPSPVADFPGQVEVKVETPAGTSAAFFPFTVTA